METFELGEVTLQSGATLPNARLAYKTYGSLDASGGNVIVMPTFYTGTHVRNEGYLRAMPALDPSRWFIVSVNMFGNGLSSSPSNTAPPFDGPRYPVVTPYDNVACQHRLLTEALGVKRIALVTDGRWPGASRTSGGRSFRTWSTPSCRSAPRRARPRTTSSSSMGPGRRSWPTARSRAATTRRPRRRACGAFARVYAGWAFSQTFYRERLHRELGFETWEELVADWERDHLDWDANDLVAKLRTWQHGDISANELYGGNFERALGAIRARAILVPCTTDLYFPPADNAIEAAHMPNAELRPYDSPWGHAVASPSREGSGFLRFLDGCVSELLAR